MNLDAGWIVGFVDGEGCFHVGINPHSEMTMGFQVLPEFTVVQHKRDLELLSELKVFFGCGVVRTNNGDRWAYRVRGIKDLNDIIIPFFSQHQLRSRKRLDFELFKQILELVKLGDHLKRDGIDQIRFLASQMNRGSVKIKSGLVGNNQGKPSEIPCRVNEHLPGT